MARTVLNKATLSIGVLLCDLIDFYLCEADIARTP